MGQECIDNVAVCKSPDYLDDGEGGCRRNEACDQCGEAHTVNGYEDNFKIKGSNLITP